MRIPSLQIHSFLEFTSNESSQCPHYTPNTQALKFSDQMTPAGLKNVANGNTACTLQFELEINSKQLFSVAWKLRPYLMPKNYSSFIWNSHGTGNPPCLLTILAPPYFQNLVGFFLVAVWVGGARAQTCILGCQRHASKALSRSRRSPSRREGDLTNVLHMCLVEVCLLPRSHLQHRLAYFLTTFSFVISIVNFVHRTWPLSFSSPPTWSGMRL